MADIWDLVGLFAAAMTSIGFIPQIIQGVRTKKMDDVSSMMILCLMAGIFLWLLYGLHLKDNIIIAANIFGFSALLLTLLLKIRYGRS